MKFFSPFFSLDEVLSPGDLAFFSPDEVFPRGDLALTLEFLVLDGL